MNYTINVVTISSEIEQRNREFPGGLGVGIPGFLCYGPEQVRGGQKKKDNNQISSEGPEFN